MILLGLELCIMRLHPYLGDSFQSTLQPSKFLCDPHVYKDQKRQRAYYLITFYFRDFRVTQIQIKRVQK
jgi:hypothetical protein